MNNGNIERRKVENIFTIDTEDWFHANYEEGLFENSGSIKSTVEENTERLLEIFAENNSTATFFVLGFVAEQHPNLIKKIASHGHEIASHGYGHQLVYNQTELEFREDVRRSKSLIEDITCKSVLGYRAPSWSITKKSLWALKVLTEEGFIYDSSIFPFENFLYGIDGAPRFQYNTKLYNENSNLIEMPPSTVHTPFTNIPFSGGFYFRVMPSFVINKMTKMVNDEANPVVFYLHPREIDPSQPRLKLNARDSLIHYWGISGCEKKLRKVLRCHKCSSLKEILNL